MPNMVRELRRKLNMSQRDLAEKAHTSQPTIQRIEADVSPVSIPTAMAIAEALGKPVGTVFPDLRAKLRGKKAKAVADEDQGDWTLTFHMRAGFDRAYLVSSEEHERVMDIVESPSRKAFACFESGGLEVAVRVNEILWVDISEFEESAANANDKPKHCLRVWFLNEQAPQDWFVVGDREESPEAEEARCQDFVTALDSVQEDDWEWSYPPLLGEDDYMFIRIQACALVEMDLSLTNPKLAQIQLEDEDGEDHLGIMPPAGHA